MATKEPRATQDLWRICLDTSKGREDGPSLSRRTRPDKADVIDTRLEGAGGRVWRQLGEPDMHVAAVAVPVQSATARRQVGRSLPLNLTISGSVARCEAERAELNRPQRMAPAKSQARHGAVGERHLRSRHRCSPVTRCHGYTRFIEPYQGGPLGVHMHDPSATRPEEVGTMTGKVHLITGSEGHGW